MTLSKTDLGKKIKEARKLKSERSGKKYTGQNLADDLKLSRSYIGDIESGRKYPSYELLTAIADACEVPFSFFNESNYYEKPKFNLDTSFNTLFAGPGKSHSPENIDLKEINNMDLNYSFITIPIVGSIRAGHPIWAEDNLQGYIPVSKNSLKTDSIYFGLKVKGDSMNLEFDEGTILIVEKTPCIENGEIGVIRINGFEATVKKVVLNDDMITLIPMSNNPEHIPNMYNLKTDDIEIIGKVKQAIKTY
ncbi:XRE family transcriptional regulator [Clostridium botulinum]|uniref:Helix-turn-helix domain-containing protein n=1 Tax=Clostridium botulinum TaxID=1491 RepID=A0A6B4JIC4_CLOBO|nr:XRE family transcriptional regulator [Clostridium botulinum]EES48233.1 LexA repressor [Clostridium botulinum E1 str. 'BoNT E Beluga']MBY6759690.1 helix-turn-helix domain-containing protein [Clostridium botulinum]MBY6918598.1 helix-turn-helix domain-containing protein [Clostridium botulinum]MCR1129681.1 XRE family transcriptional regulator [Clostridium botulinum]NFG27677.1 helix-turn-helix domain-containing protein [Clostridium botulinum]